MIDDFKKLYAENERDINNMLAAIEQGVVTSSTQSRLLNLEKRKDELLHNIAIQNAMQREPMTINEITNYLKSFKGLDCSPRESLISYNICEIYLSV